MNIVPSTSWGLVQGRPSILVLHQVQHLDHPPLLRPDRSGRRVLLRVYHLAQTNVGSKSFVRERGMRVQRDRLLLK